MMNKILIMIWIAVVLICVLWEEEVHAEWKMTDEIFLGNARYSFGHGSIDYNKVTKNIYIRDALSGKTSIVDAETMTIVNQIILDNYVYHGFDYKGIIVDETKNLIYEKTSGSEISIIDGNTNQVLNLLRFHGYISSWALDFELNKLYIASSRINSEEKIYSLNVFDLKNLESIYSFEVSRFKITGDEKCSINTTLSVNQNNHRVYFGYSKPYQDYDNINDFIAVIDGNIYQINKIIYVGNEPTNCVVNENTGFVYVLNGRGVTISVIDEKTNNVVKNIDIMETPLYGAYFGAMEVNKINNKIYYSNMVISGETHTIENNLYINESRPWANQILSMAVDELSGKIFTSAGSSHLCVIDANTYRLKQYFSSSVLSSSITIIPENNILFAVGYKGVWFHREEDDYFIKTIDLGEKKLVDSIDASNFLGEALLANPSNGYIYLSHWEEGISAYDSNNKHFLPWVGFLREEDNLFGSPNDMVFDTILKRLYVANVGHNTISVLDANTLEILKKIIIDPIIYPILTTDIKNHKLYICGQNESTVYVYDGETFQELQKKNIGYQVYDIISCPSGGKIYLGTLNNGLVALESSTLKEIVKLPISLSILGQPLDFQLYIDDTFNLLIAIYGNLNDGYYISFFDTISDNVLSTLKLEKFDAMYDFCVSINNITGKVYVLNSAISSIMVFEDPANPLYISPSPPTSLTSSTDTAITFTWTPVDHPDAQGYNIYRSQSGANQWTRLNSELVTHTSYLDETFIPNVPYDYRIATMGLYNIEGEPSEPITATLTLEPDFTLSPVLSFQSTSRNTLAEYYITSESIEQFAKLIDIETTGLPEEIDGTFTPNPLRPGEVSLLQLMVPSGVSPGEHQFEVIGTANDIEHRVSLQLRVVETELAESVITLDLSSPTIEYGSTIYATGKIIPTVSDEVSVTFASIHGTETVTAMSGSDGTFSFDFEPPSAGEWTASASWPGNVTYAGSESDLQSFDALSGRTKITCTTDAPAEAEVGWQMTIKGKVFPNPEVGSVTMYVKKPDGTEEEIDGLLINELGYYGYNITADQPGFWEVTALWAGNDKYLGSVSETLVVPYGLDIGRAIIAVCPNDSRPFYYTANRLGKLIYKTFSSRRFDSPRIQYLDVDENQDLNEDGFIRDVAGPPTMENIEQTITDWATGSVNDETPLCIYLIGEGTSGGIELSDGSVLSAPHFHALLGELETSTGCNDVVVVVDAPHSGTFIRELSKLGRCVITSTNLGEANYIAQGKLSFSQFFCNASCEGKSIRDAFLFARNTISRLPGDFKYQDPLVESEGNIIANETSDYQKTAGWYFGSSYGLQDLMPRVLPAQPQIHT